MSYSFKTQAAIGRKGEEEVIAWLQRSGFEVQDVSANPEWQARDIDLILNGGLWAEIKTDTHPPEHLFAELTVGGKEGYVFKTRADVLLYYFSGYRKLLWLSPSALAWWVEEHPGLRRVQIRSKRGNSEWLAEGLVVPVAGLRDAKLIKEYSLDEVYGRVA